MTQSNCKELSNEMQIEPALATHYRTLLTPLFQWGGDAVHYVFALLRADGYEVAGWDTLLESFELLTDVTGLWAGTLPEDTFPTPTLTRLRLQLLEYVHLVEMNAPYDIITNLCRVKLGMPASIRPFARASNGCEVGQNVVDGLPGNISQKPRSTMVTPTAKIDKIKSLSRKLNQPEVGTAFNDFYFNGIRNAVSHSDYIFHNDEFRMRSEVVRLPNSATGDSSIVPLKQLNEILARAFAFYGAFFDLEHQARASFVGLRGKPHVMYPIDEDKGLIEYLFDEKDLLCGVKVHWPNGSESEYRRSLEGSRPKNIIPYPNGELDLMVGNIPRTADPFSRLVELGGKPKYTPLEGSNAPLEWPETTAQ